MRHNMALSRAFFLMGWLALSSFAEAYPQDVDVQAQVKVTQAAAQKPVPHSSSPAANPSPTVVVWLNRVPSDTAAPVDLMPPGHFRMAQKNKNFDPHLLVVPLGSTIEFPNLDPFFHNVFSQFNGKRFDLGLYEAGSTKTVHFDHVGVSYIFCNIHPGMAAVIVTLASPYYSVSIGSGNVVLRHVHEGTYEMHVWAEGADVKQLETLTRRVHIGPSQNSLGAIPLVTTAAPSPHKNKFGEDYKTDEPPTY